MDTAKLIEWKDSGRRNQVLSGDGFFVSYNRKPGSVIALFAADNDGDETALVRDRSYFILNGDFRADYERLVSSGFAACKAFYDANKAKFGSSWSSDEEA